MLTLFICIFHSVLIIILDDYQSYKFDLLIKVAQLIDVKPMHVGDNKIILRKYES